MTLRMASSRTPPDHRILLNRSLRRRVAKGTNYISSLTNASLLNSPCLPTMENSGLAIVLFHRDIEKIYIDIPCIDTRYLKIYRYRKYRYQYQ